MLAPIIHRLTSKSDEIIDVIISDLVPLMQLTKQTGTIIDIMTYIASTPKERRLPLVAKVASTYPTVVKFSPTDLFNYIKVVSLLL